MEAPINLQRFGGESIRSTSNVVHVVHRGEQWANKVEEAKMDEEEILIGFSRSFDVCL